MFLIAILLCMREHHCRAVLPCSPFSGQSAAERTRQGRSAAETTLLAVTLPITPKCDCYVLRFII